MGEVPHVHVSPRRIVPHIAYRRCADDRSGYNRYGMTLESLLLQQLQLDHGDALGVDFTAETIFLPGSTAGGAMTFADPQTLLQHLKDGMSHSAYADRFSKLAIHRELSFESYDTLFHGKGVRKTVLTVHTGCSHLKRKLEGCGPDDEMPFLRQILKDGAEYFHEMEPGMSVFGYVVHTDERYITGIEPVIHLYATDIVSEQQDLARSHGGNGSSLRAE